MQGTFNYYFYEISAWPSIYSHSLLKSYPIETGLLFSLYLVGEKEYWKIKKCLPGLEWS